MSVNNMDKVTMERPTLAKTPKERERYINVMFHSKITPLTKGYTAAKGEGWAPPFISSAQDTVRF